MRSDPAALTRSDPHSTADVPGVPQLPAGSGRSAWPLGHGRLYLPAMARGKSDPLRRRWGLLRVALLALCVAATAGGTALAFRQGLVPPLINPLPVIDLAQAGPGLVDWRLASIKYYPSVCARTLKAPHIDAQQVADGPMQDGCGWSNAVRLVAAGGVHASFDKITCETAVALALWLEHEVQPLAMELFGQRVASLRSFGSYACRNIVGNPLWSRRRSEHAIANAADIAGFTLADGRQISVRRHWKSEGAEGRFLREAHARACPYFRAALGPAFNGAHRDHFHLDRGPFSRCR
jgi:hypothetical protein